MHDSWQTLTITLTNRIFAKKLYISTSRLLDLGFVKNYVLQDFIRDLTITVNNTEVSKYMEKLFFE